MRRIYSVPYQLIEWLLSYAHYYLRSFYNDIINNYENLFDTEYDAKPNCIISVGDNLLGSEIHNEVLQTILKNAEDK